MMRCADDAYRLASKMRQQSTSEIITSHFLAFNANKNAHFSHVPRKREKC